MWYRNKPIPIPDKLIAQIKATRTTTLGSFEEELSTAWKHLFPITSSSMRTGNLALDHLVWGITPNLWWRFLTDMPLLSEKETTELNELRKPLVTPHLDEFGWLVQERKVIDFRGSISIHLGNFPTMKLFQTLPPIRTCDLLVSSKEEIQGILNYMVVWKPD